MAITVLTNMASVNVRGHLERTAENYSKAVERLASGKRINRAGDDAAGLSIANNLEARVRSIQAARRNAQDALSMMQVVEGGMNEVGNLVIRLRELAIQAASDNVSDKEREMLELEVGQIREEVERLAHGTRYFGNEVLSGSAKELVFQVGIENTEWDRITYDSGEIDLRASTLGVDDVQLSDKDSALDSLSTIENALTKLGTPRAKIGALQFRMHSTINNLNTYEESLTAATSRIMDADMAKEAANAVQAQVLQKTGVAVLAQANLQPTIALRLLENF